jgi:RNA-directed DNA polymerase
MPSHREGPNVKVDKLMNDSQDGQGKLTVPEADTTGRMRTVKPSEVNPRALPSSAHPAGISSATDEGVWEQVFNRENLIQALRRVEQNGGAAGIDGMTTAQLRPYLKQHWVTIRAQLDAGTYQPSPVRPREIPKPGGGMRRLGIPTVLDRFIQQALLQALTPRFEPIFSPHSYGFRPGRSAHDAVRAAQGYINEGYTCVVDLDIEQFFDRVNHDKLMARVARVVKDKRVLKLIRKYLNSGVMVNGVKAVSPEGTPQGGPLSPLLANIMLDDLDKELEQRGHRFVRYADDCNIYVKSQRAGERVLGNVAKFLKLRLSLKINPKKSGIHRPARASLLGFSFWWRGENVIIRIARKAVVRGWEHFRELTRRSRSGRLEVIIRSINEFTTGWVGYFRLADTETVFQDLDKWLRRRLRQMVWKRWKRGRTRWQKLVGLGVPPDMAALGAGGSSPWRMARTPVVNMALNNAYWERAGLVTITERYRQMRSLWRTAGCNKACPVV